MDIEPHAPYLAALPEPERAALEHLRNHVLKVAPNAREVFSYGLPAFRVAPGKSKVLLGYAATKQHLSLYPFDSDVVAEFADRLAGFSTSKGTIRFTPDHPLPADLIQDITAARLAKVT